MQRRSSIIGLMFLLASCASQIPSTKPGANAPFSNEKLTVNKTKPGHARPLIAIVGPNSGTETTDYVIPLSVLRRSGLADVIALSTESGPVNLMPALRIVADQTTAAFDTQHPEGADIVIVPAVHDSEDKMLLHWLNSQIVKKTQIISICEGARVVANTGLFEGRAAATHWYAIEDLKSAHRQTQWQQNARYVQSNGVISTTGVTASIPVSLALVEAIGGAGVAAQLARQLRVTDYSSLHNGEKFQLNWSYKWLVVRNVIAFWSHEKIGIPVADGVDELSLALVADAYSRTYRSNAVTQSDAPEIKTLHNLRLLPDISASKRVDHQLSSQLLSLSSTALEGTLENIRDRYGARTAAFVALQLEYPSEW